MPQRQRQQRQRQQRQRQQRRRQQRQRHQRQRDVPLQILDGRHRGPGPLLQSEEGEEARLGQLDDGDTDEAGGRPQERDPEDGEREEG